MCPDSVACSRLSGAAHLASSHAAVRAHACLAAMQTTDVEVAARVETLCAYRTLTPKERAELLSLVENHTDARTAHAAATNVVMGDNRRVRCPG